MDDDPADEDAVFEVDLDAVDIVFFALAVVSLGFNALVSDSILAAMAPVLRGCWCPVLVMSFFNPSLPHF